nr:MAG TPA: hypothetical protein [Bacteriophage sp.]
MLLSASAMYNIELRVEREKLQYKALGLISEDYALPNNHNSLSNFGWSSFFPNKVYSFAHSGSSSNGYDYVDFLEDRYKNNLPLRLLAYEMPKNIGSALNNAINKTVVKIIYDDFVLVEKFEYSTDVVGDIPYSVNFQEFNANIVRSSGKDTAKSIMATASVNMVTNAALKASGLL